MMKFRNIKDWRINSILLLCFIAFSCTQCTTDSESKMVVTRSPNERLVFSLEKNEKEQFSYSVLWKGDTIIQPSLLQLRLKGDRNIPDSMVVTEVQTTSKDTVWHPVCGEQNSYRNHFCETLVKLRFVEEKEPALAIRIRCYDTGVAFRYEFLDHRTWVIKSEKTQFVIEKMQKVLAASYPQHPSVLKEVEKIKKGLFERPLLIENARTTYLSIGEAGLINYTPFKLRVEGGDSPIITTELGKSLLKIDATCKQTSWRYLLVGKSPVDILQNNGLALNLNKPSQLEDADWIRPGKVLREISLTTKGAKKCVDFAEKYDLQYLLFDAGWYGHEHDAKADAKTWTLDPKRSKGPFNLKEIIAYAKTKGVGIILYVNHIHLETQAEELFPLYEKWGIAGVKFGFVNTGNQVWTKWLHKYIRLAAKYHLMVNVHDNYRPTGWSRTYPNLMTLEGVCGDEESASNTTVINTLFTRMVAGAADQTNCYCDKRVYEKMGSRVSQMAKTILIYSPWQHLFWYDTPTTLLTQRKLKVAGKPAEDFLKDELVFFKSLPTVWDETVVLDGYPNKHALIARRKGKTWFIAGITGENSHQYHFKPDFLEDGKLYNGICYADKWEPKHGHYINIWTEEVKKEHELYPALDANSGWVMVLKEKN